MWTDLVSTKPELYQIIKYIQILLTVKEPQEEPRVVLKPHLYWMKVCFLHFHH